MTSAGPYQSRLFNLILRRGRQWRDRVRQKLRGLKLFSRWTLELLAVPLLAFWRSQKQAPAVEPQAPPVAALPSDHPVQEVLAIAERWHLTVSDAPRSLFRRAPSTIARGIATDLRDRSLVLVDHNNQLIVLTTAQRLELQQRLVWWLAQRRQLISRRSRFRLRGVVAQLLLPLRAIAQATQWLLQPAAIAAPPLLTSAEILDPSVVPTAIAGSSSRLGLPPSLNDTTLDATVTSVGYIRHPLQFLVDWFDRAIAWLEQRLLQAWNWYKVRRDR